MSDTNLNITVTTQNKELQELITKLNSGNITVKDFSKTMRELRSASIPGSQALKDLGDVTAQVSMKSKSAEAQERSFTNVIRESRQERRLYRYAMLEGVAAIESMTGKEDVLTKSVTNGAQAVFGMKFALDAMGLSAKAAWPVAIIVAAWSVISGILDSQKKKTEELNEVLRENLELQIKLGMVQPEVGVEADIKKLKEEEAKLAELKTKGHSVTTMGEYGNLVTTSYAADANEIAKQENIILKLREKIQEENKKIADENGKLLDKFKEGMDNTLENEANFYKESESLFLQHINAEGDALDRYLARFRDPKEKLLLYQLKGIEQRGNRTESYEKLGGVSGFAETPGEKVTFEGVDKSLMDFSESLKSSTIAADAMSEGLNGTTNNLANAFTGLITGTRNVGQAFSEFTSSMLQMLAQIAAQALAKEAMSGLLGIVGIATGSPAIGGGGPSIAGSMRASIQASRVGAPAVQVVPIVSASGLSVMVKYGEQTRADRVW
jgi:hypothetical protein